MAAKITFKAARVSQYPTQQACADAMGVSRSTVNDWETGKTKIRTPYLILFCCLTGFSPDDIILPTIATNSGVNYTGGGN